MKKTTKTWLIIAGALVLAGCIVFAVVMSTIGWDFKKLSTVKYETNTYEVGEAFGGISIDTNTADVVLALSDDGKCRVECYEEQNAKHSAEVLGNVLTIKVNDKRSVYDYVGFHFGSPKITVYLPQAEYKALLVSGSTGKVEVPKGLTFESADIALSTGNIYFGASVVGTVKFKTTTGNIRVENCFAGSLDLSVSTGMVTVFGVTCDGGVTVDVTTGKADLTDISCKNVVSGGSTGSIVMSKVIASEKLSIKRSTGSVKFNDCDAAEIYVKTNTGDISGSLLSDKVFIANSDTGSVDVPKTSAGGRCEIDTNTGSIRMTVR